MSRTILAALLLVACDPAPACADGQQNPCKCGELDGTQTCAAGTYSACDCSAAEKTVEELRERLEAKAAAQKAASDAAADLLALKDEQGRLEQQKKELEEKLGAAATDAEREALRKELEALDAELAGNAQKQEHRRVPSSP